MSNAKQFHFLFVGQSRNVAANLQLLIQTHALSIFNHKGGAIPPDVEFRMAGSQREALQIIRSSALDVILLETGSSNGNRRKFAEMIRKQQPIARIIEVARERAKSPHPFNGFLRLPVESQQIIEVLQRCTRPGTNHLIPFGQFVLDSANDVLIAPDGEKALRPMETKLLAYLIENRGTIVKRIDIMRHVWGTEYYGDTRTLDVHIRQLRKHIEENPSAPQYLITDRGRGYLFNL